MNLPVNTDSFFPLISYKTCGLRFEAGFSPGPQILILIL